MVNFYNRKLKEHARRLRKNMTDTERFLWSRIRGKQLNGYQFYRQRPIGNFIVDFYCPAARLVIELDGGQHFEEEGKTRDMLRDDYLRGIGIKVLRFSDRDVFKNIEGVIEEILGNLPEPPNPPSIPPFVIL